LGAGVDVAAVELGKFLSEVFVEGFIVHEVGEVVADEAGDVLLYRLGGNLVAIGAALGVAAMVDGADVVTCALGPAHQQLSMIYWGTAT